MAQTLSRTQRKGRGQASPYPYSWFHENRSFIVQCTPFQSTISIYPTVHMYLGEPFSETHVTSLYSNVNLNIQHCTPHYTRAGEPANFFRLRLRLRLLTFFSIGSGSWFFSQAAPAPAPDYWLSLPKYSFPHKLVR